MWDHLAIGSSDLQVFSGQGAGAVPNLCVEGVMVLWGGPWSWPSCVSWVLGEDDLDVCSHRACAGNGRWAEWVGSAGHHSLHLSISKLLCQLIDEGTGAFKVHIITNSYALLVFSFSSPIFHRCLIKVKNCCRGGRLYLLLLILI